MRGVQSLSETLATTTETGAAALASALEESNIPTLLLVLIRLTGDPRWLQEPFRPTPAIGLDDHDSGGLSPQAQATVRREAHRAITAWRAGTLAAQPAPSPERIAELLAFALAEEVPPAYGELLAEELGTRPRAVGPPARGIPTALDVLVVGAGMAGINIAIELGRAGIPYTVLEKNAEVGGTWLENRYPGCGVDTPSHLYSFSFARRADWQHYFARRDQLAEYFRALADEHALRDHIAFGTEVLGAAWDAGAARWHVDLRRADGTRETVSARVLITSVGHFNRPSIPPIKGLDSFPGPCMHTAEWDPGVAVAGRRVGVVGTGASAMQLVPALAGDAARVLIFQRGRQWVIPHPNQGREVSPATQHLLEHVPFYAGWYRLRHFWRFGDRLHSALRVDPAYASPDQAVSAINDRHRRYLTKYIESELEGRPDLIAASIPDYPVYGRRPLIDHGWYRSIRRDDVELIEGGVAEVRGSTVITHDGREFEVDVLALATGFKTLELLGPLQITGRSGRSLRETWGEHDARAYLGIAVPDFPNLFVLYGPNTTTGHGGSAFLTTEMQVRYVMQLLVAMVEDDLASVEVRPEVHEAYDAELTAALDALVYTHPKVHGYYRNESGRIIGSNPWEYIDYWRRTLTPDLDDFTVRRHE
jgi:4-hydroxyacetophenone monooxygenase